MTEKQHRPSVRFCPGCGEPAGAEANYCTACGSAFRPTGGRAPRQAVAGAQQDRPPLAGLIVLGAFLATGLGLWFLILRPESGGGRLPLAEKKSEPIESTASGETTSLPADHPPLEIPQEVKAYLSELEAKANQSPGDLAIWKTLAQVQYRAGQIDHQYLDKAKTSYDHALGLDAKDLEVLRGLGNVYFDRQEYPAAVNSYARYLEIKPDDANVRTDLATMFLYSGEDDRAIQEYQKVLERDPKFYQAHFNLGIAYVKKGDSAKAVSAFTKAKDLAPDDHTRAQIQTMMDRASGAPSPRTEASAPAASFQDRVEQMLRGHPIAGPKVVKFEWPSSTTAQAVLDNFPMESMPEFARTKFLDRLKGELAEARRASGAPGTARLELVDRASGRVMATVTAE